MTLSPERGRSPPAARRSVEVVWSIPEPFHQLSCCGPGLRRAEVASATQAGRSAVRLWRRRATHSLGDGSCARPRVASCSRIDSADADEIFFD